MDFALQKLANVLERGRMKIRRQRGLVSYALNDLDLQLDAILKKRDGVYIEAGANNGLNQSNTVFFERHRGWTGLLIEPLPDKAEQCLINRPHSIVEQCALVSNVNEEKDIELIDCDLMSFASGTLLTISEEEYRQRGEKCQNIESRVVTVPAKTLTSLLEKHNFTHIDLLSLDVEGSEIDVMRGLDFTRFAPEWMLIEECLAQGVEAFLAPRYQLIARLSEHDVLYKLRDLPLE